MNTSAPSASTTSPAHDPGESWATAFACSAAAICLLQLRTLLAWHAAAARFNEEAWDLWQCRFAGGVPIDG